VTLLERTAKLNPPDLALTATAAFLAVLGAGAFTQPAVAGSDLWWHLASGRDLWAAGGLPGADRYSFSAVGDQWMNHEWLWDLIYWGAYRIHPQAVAWFHFGVLLAVFLGVFTLAKRASGSLGAAVLVTWASAATAHWFLDVRPHVWTLLLVQVVLLTRDRAWAPWLWAPLMVVWANLHGGFVFGAGTIGLFAVIDTLRRSLAARVIVIPRRIWIGVAGALLAMAVNPWGFAVLSYPLAYLDSASPFRTIVEWRPPGLSPGYYIDPRYFQGRFWCLVVLVLPGAALAARRDPYAVALAGVAFAMAATSRRFIPLFAVIAAPLAAIGLAWAATRLRSRWAHLRHPAVGLAAAGAALLVVVSLWGDVRMRPGLLERWTQADLYPRAALRFLRALRAPDTGPLRVLNFYNWGGYLMLHAPEMRLLIDGRANTLYDDRTFLDYLAMMGGRPGFRARLASYPADAALLPRGAFASGLLKLPEPWTLLYSDDQAQLLVPPRSSLISRPQPVAARLLSDEAMQMLRRGRQARARRDPAGALDAFEAAVAQEPLSVISWSALFQQYALMRDRSGLDDAVQRSFSAVPRRRSELARSGSGAYERMGDPIAAYALARQGIPTGPFRSPTRSLQRLEALGKRLQ
jgi:hypothetical protein